MDEQNASMVSQEMNAVAMAETMAHEIRHDQEASRALRASEIHERIFAVPTDQAVDPIEEEQPVAEEVIGEVAPSIVLDNNRATPEDLEQIAMPETREEMLMAVHEAAAVADELDAELLPGTVVPMVTDDELVLFNDPKYKEPEPVDPTPRLKVLAEPEAPNTKKHYKLEFNAPAMELLRLHTGDITGDTVAFSFVRTNPFIVRVPQDAENQFSRLFHIKGGGSFADKFLNSQLRMIAQRDPQTEVSFVLELQEMETKFPVVVRLREEAPVTA